MDTALTLPFTYRKFFKKISIVFKNLFQFCKWNLIAKLNCKKRWKGCQNFCKKVMMRKNSSNKKLPQSLKACLIYYWSNFYPSWKSILLKISSLPRSLFSFLFTKAKQNKPQKFGNFQLRSLSSSKHMQGRKWRVDRVGNCPPRFWQIRRCRLAAAARCITTNFGSYLRPCMHEEDWLT